MSSVQLNRQQTLQNFFAEVEQRAYQYAEFAVQNPDEALDLVQNSMLKLVQYYADRDSKELTLLFYRILQNEIKDWKRKAWVRGWFGAQEQNIDTLQDQSTGSNPEHHYHSTNLSDHVQQAIRDLPYRQQQVFMLRAWEGLDVKQTAKVMKCTTGSVKTHYARALNSLRTQLSGWST